MTHDPDPETPIRLQKFACISSSVYLCSFETVEKCFVQKKYNSPILAVVETDCGFEVVTATSVSGLERNVGVPTPWNCGVGHFMGCRNTTVSERLFHLCSSACLHWFSASSIQSVLKSNSVAGKPFENYCSPSVRSAPLDFAPAIPTVEEILHHLRWYRKPTNNGVKHLSSNGSFLLLIARPRLSLPELAPARTPRVRAFSL